MTSGDDTGVATVTVAGGDQVPLSELREVPCYFCDVHDEQLLFREDAWRVVSCKRCGHVYVNPRLPPERLHEMYQEDYWESERAKEFGYTRYLAERPLYERTNRGRATIIERFKRGLAQEGRQGQVLDVGCAAGFFLSVMRERGWGTVGIEISKPMVEYASGTLGLPEVHRGDILTVDLEPGRFDVITFWDVIEHLEDPAAHLARAHELLHRNGILVLETQNVASLFARLLGRKWQHYKHSEHLYHFHPESLGRLLARAGFEIIENRSQHGGKYVSMQFLQERVGRIHPVFSALASPLKLFGDAALYLNFHDEMIAVAKRR